MHYYQYQFSTIILSSINSIAQLVFAHTTILPFTSWHSSSNHDASVKVMKYLHVAYVKLIMGGQALRWTSTCSTMSCAGNLLCWLKWLVVSDLNHQSFNLQQEAYWVGMSGDVEKYSGKCLFLSGIFNTLLHTNITSTITFGIIKPQVTNNCFLQIQQL